MRCAVLLSTRLPSRLHGRLIGRLIGFVVLVLVSTGTARAVEIQRVTSPGGIEAWLVEDRINPIISMDVVWRGGAALDPKGKTGLANMVAGLLDEGAGVRDSQAFRRALEDNAITIKFDAGRDTFFGMLKTLSANRDLAFGLLRDALIEPRFDAEPVERIRKQILTGLMHSAEDPNEIASETLNALVFGDHGYARKTEGTAETVAAIEAEDLRAFARARLGRDNLVIGVVGDISAGELATLLDQTFGVLPAKAAPWGMPDADVGAGGDVRVVEKAIPQSVIAMAAPGLKRDDSDYYAALLVNHVLGGGSFTSRLYDEVREKRGLAYSVYSGLYPLRHAGVVVAGGGTTNESVTEMIAIIRAEWQKMAKEGPTEAELQDAKTYITGSFPLRFTSSDAVAGILAAMQLHGLGIDYLDRRNALIESVAPAHAKRVAARLLGGAGPAIVVVGSPKGLESKAE